MTWRHHVHRRKDGCLFREWYFCDLGLVSFLIVWYADLPCWQLTAPLKYDDFADLNNRRFDTAEDAMSAVEERLASFAQDLLSDALGIRRIQEAK